MMINGVLHIVAAVLFAAVYLFEGLGKLWLWVALAYLVIGLLNLVGHVFSVKMKQKAAVKEAKAREAEKVKAEAEKAKAAEAEKAAAAPEQV